jgi:hypothetical protein
MKIENLKQSRLNAIIGELPIHLTRHPATTRIL